MTLIETVKPLRRGLVQLRGRVRSLLMVLGASRLVLVLVLALTGFFLADYFLRLPLEVRRILHIAILLGLVVVVYRHLVRPLSTPLTDQMLAARVEAAHPELENRLSSSLAFVGAEEDPDNDDSPELMRHVVEETAAMSNRIPFHGVARTGPATRWASAAASLLIVMCIGAVVRADLVATFVQRSLLLRDISWPRRTTLTVVGMRPGLPRRVTRGRETTIDIRAQGAKPGRVTFRYWERAASERRPETLDLTPSSKDARLFTVTLPVYADYEFTVTGGDDDRELVYSLRALTPPSILSIEMDVTYPAYLNRGNETLSGGDQRLPEGCQVVLRVRSDMALKGASIAMGDEKPVEMESAAPDRYTARLDAAKDLRYSIRLRGRNGQENDPRSDTFFLRVLEDRAPVIRVHAPGPRAERLAGGVVLIACDVRDDHEVRAVRLRLRVNEGKTRVFELGAPPEGPNPGVRLDAAKEGDRNRMRALAVLDLPRLRDDDGKPVTKGDQIDYVIEAVDSKGQSQLTRDDSRISILAEDDLAQQLLGRQQTLRESLQRTDEHANTAMSDTEEVRAQRGRDAGEFRRWSGRAQAAQARVISDLVSLGTGIRELLNLHVFNRQNDATAIDQILPYYERHLLNRDESARTAYGGDLYRALWTAQSERAIRARGTLVKMLELADLSDRLAADSAPEAYRALRELSTARSSEDIGKAIDAAVQQQKIVRDGLARIERLMREWETYQSVVNFFKMLRQKERSLINELEGIHAPDGSEDD